MGPQRLEKKKKKMSLRESVVHYDRSLTIPSGHQASRVHLLSAVP